jgi:Mg2+ and Co2+ transporter CorA
MVETKENYKKLNNEEKEKLDKEAKIELYQRKFILNERQREKKAAEITLIIQDLLKDLDVQCGYESFFAGVSRLDSLSRVTAHSRKSFGTLYEMTRETNDVFTKLLSNYQKPIPYQLFNLKSLQRQLKTRMDDLFIESKLLTFPYLVFLSKIIDYSLTFLTKCDWKKLVKKEYDFVINSNDIPLKLPNEMTREECLELLNRLDRDELRIEIKEN